MDYRNSFNELLSWFLCVVFVHLRCDACTGWITESFYLISSLKYVNNIHEKRREQVQLICTFWNHWWCSVPLSTSNRRINWAGILFHAFDWLIWHKCQSWIVHRIPLSLALSVLMALLSLSVDSPPGHSFYLRNFLSCTCIYYIHMKY